MKVKLVKIVENIVAIGEIARFQTFRHILMLLQQTTYENIMSIEEIDLNEQFLYLSQDFQPFSKIIFSFVENVLYMYIP